MSLRFFIDFLRLLFIVVRSVVWNIKEALSLFFFHLFIFRKFFIFVVFSKILLAKGTGSTLRKPFFNTFIVERVLTIQICNDVMVWNEFLQANRAWVIAKFRVVIEMFTFFEEPRCSRILNNIWQIEWDMMWWVREITDSVLVKLIWL